MCVHKHEPLDCHAPTEPTNTVERGGRQGTDTATHVQLVSSSLAQQRLAAGNTRAAPSPECCAASPAASVQRAVMQLGPSALCQAPCLEPGLVPPNREGRGAGHAQHPRDDTVLTPGLNGRNVPVQDRFPALNPYKHHVPAPHHSGIPAALMSPSSTLPWPAPPFLAAGAAADLTAALSCHDAWLAAAPLASPSRNAAERRQPAVALQNCDTSQLAPGCTPGEGGTGAPGSKGWSHLPQGCTVTARG